jgi:hypothetical protein
MCQNGLYLKYLKLIYKIHYTCSGKTTFDVGALSLLHSRQLNFVMRHTIQLFITLLLLFPGSVFSQAHLADIRPLLKSLTQDQKQQLLEYFRHLGAEVDEEIQNAYERIPKVGQQKAVQFIESLKRGQKHNQFASVIWSRDTLFIGDITEGTIRLDSFKVTNTGTSPYLISKTKSTCDCIVVNFPKHPIMPSESALLRFEFDSSGKLGTTIPAIIIYDNSTPNKRNILYIKGNVVARQKPRKYPWED